MKPLTSKIGVAIASLGTLGAATYFGTKDLWKTISIKERLKKEKFKFIEFNDIAQWNEEFESDSKNIFAKLSVNSGNDLRGKCQSMMNLNSKNNNETMENVKKWCGIRKISSQLLRKGKKFLVDLNGASDEVEAKWRATYEKRKLNGTNRKHLGLEGEWPSGNKDEMNEFKKVCREKGEGDYLVSSKDAYFAVEDWCTVEAALKVIPPKS